MATSISLPYEQILRILEGWLNEHELRQPHEVFDMDYIDASGGAINIGLRPRPEPVVAVAPPSDYTLPLRIDGAPTMPRNHGYNGHSAPQAPQPDVDDVAPVSGPSEELAPAQPAARRKSGRGHPLTDAQRRRILELSTAGRKVADIAAEVGCSEASVFDVRKAARSQPSPEAPAGDG